MFCLDFLFLHVFLVPMKFALAFTRIYERVFFLRFLPDCGCESFCYKIEGGFPVIFFFLNITHLPSAYIFHLFGPDFSASSCIHALIVWVVLSMLLRAVLEGSMESIFFQPGHISLYSFDSYEYSQVSRDMILDRAPRNRIQGSS